MKENRDDAGHVIRHRWLVGLVFFLVWFDKWRIVATLNRKRATALLLPSMKFDPARRKNEFCPLGFSRTWMGGGRRRAVAGGGASVAGDDVHSTGWKMFRPVWQPASGGFLFPVSPLFVFIIIIDIYLYNDWHRCWQFINTLELEIGMAKIVGLKTYLEFVFLIRWIMK